MAATYSTPGPTKTCNKCRRGLPLSAFGKKACNKDGLQYACKECHNALSRPGPRRYRAARRFAAASFWDYVDKSGQCWTWQGNKYPTGYGRFGRNGSAHRYAYKQAYGTIPRGMHVCHRCDNPPCVRPDHLFLGTNAENMHDRNAKGRQSKGRKASLAHQGKSARLTVAQVREIRRRYVPGQLLQRELAQEYGVSKSLIRDICSRRAWAWLDDQYNEERKAA
jgi:hypothetical protein